MLLGGERRVLVVVVFEWSRRRPRHGSVAARILAGDGPQELDPVAVPNGRLLRPLLDPDDATEGVASLDVSVVLEVRLDRSSNLAMEVERSLHPRPVKVRDVGLVDVGEVSVAA